MIPTLMMRMTQTLKVGMIQTLVMKTVRKKNK